MILDTFYLLFKSDAKSAEADVKALDKQISELAGKGKKRSEEEQKELKELRKRRQEQIQDLKDTTRETDKLGDSFQNVTTSIIGAAAAYTSLGFLKNGLIDANKLNASLQVLSDTYHLNAKDLKGYAAALEQAGGNGQDFINFVVGQAQFSQQNRLPILQPGQWIERLRQLYKAPFGETNITRLGALPLVELLNKSPDEFDKLRASGFEAAHLRDEDTQAALKNQESFAKTRQEFDKIATEIDTYLLGSLRRLNTALQRLADSSEGHPGLALGSSVALSALTGLGGWKLIKWLRGFLPGASAGTAASGIGFSEIIPALSAGIAATWGAGALGEWIGSKLRRNPTSTSLSAKQKVLSFWQQQGYAPGAAAGWTANAQAESSFNPNATNGSHFGLYQWSQSRREKIRVATGIDVATASLTDQLKAAAWEASQMGLGPSAIPNDPRQAAALISNRYEIPSLTSYGLASEAAHRANIAASYGGTSGSSHSITVKTGDITIQTQATDAKGIAGDVGAELRNQIRMAMSNFDDGVNY